MKPRLFALALMLAASRAFAADIDGHWTGSLDTPTSPVEPNFSFKVDSTKLTGRSTSPGEAAFMIRDNGTVGGNLSFALAVDFGGKAFDSRSRKSIRARTRR